MSYSNRWNLGGTSQSFCKSDHLENARTVRRHVTDAAWRHQSDAIGGSTNFASSSNSSDPRVLRAGLPFFEPSSFILRQDLFFDQKYVL